MILKGIEKLNEFVGQWLYQNDFDVQVELSTDFSCDTITDTIYYALCVPQAHDTMFEKVFEEVGLEYECDNFLLSFFHELGHIETECELTDEEIEISETKKALMEEKTNLSDNDYWEYYHLPDEILATTWATNFINENPNLIENFWCSFQKLVKDFYKENGIEEN